MKTIAKTLVFTAVLLIFGSVASTVNPATSNHAAVVCCDDPLPTCPPICGPGGGSGSVR